ncbi:Glycerol-3-phosphate dehydrogenase [uncultured Gammaproteobacteria bacterium]
MAPFFVGVRDMSGQPTPLVPAEPVFDLLVIGGGINGLGIARDAAGRGLSVLLCEQNDLGSGTSSTSSGLIHGGLRYLEQGNFRLVAESLAEREVLLHVAPHLIRPLRFVLPHDHSQRPAWLIRLGLLLYDHLGKRRVLPGSQALDLTDSPLAAGLRPAFRRGFSYWDCQVFDARLVVANAIDAHERGAVILTRTRCLAATRDQNRWRVRLSDTTTGREWTVVARLVINAAGPWAGQVLTDVLRHSGAERLRLVKGSHIVVPRVHDGDHGLILQNPDRRVVFVLPYERQFSLIGTTDVPFSGDPAAAVASDQEVGYLCAAASRYLARPVTAADVVTSFAGVRPLHDDRAGNPAAVTRDYQLELDAPPGQAPLLTVFGGKLTSYRVLAERVLERVAGVLGRPSGPAWAPAWTAKAVLPGGEDPAESQAALTQCQDWLPAGLAERWARLYGARAGAVLGGARALADLGRGFGGGLYAREVAWLREHEFARNAEDILFRRTRLGLVLSKHQRDALAKWLN